jgi:hypothetical protein
MLKINEYTIGSTLLHFTSWWNKHLCNILGYICIEFYSLSQYLTVNEVMVLSKWSHFVISHTMPQQNSYFALKVTATNTAYKMHT